MNNQAAQTMPETGSWIAADDVSRHARTIDVALNGEAGAASRPALCDVVAQIASLARKNGPLAAALSQTAGEDASHERARLLVPVLKESAEYWGNHHCASELKRAIEIIEDLLLAAAPSASGGECHKPCTPIDFFNGDACPDCVTRDYSPQPPAAASVSELARELLAAEYERDGFDPVGAQQIREGFVNNTTATALRAIEQALTQQRGANPWKDAVLDALANTAMDAPVEAEPAIIVAKLMAWHERLSTNPPDAPAMRITIIQKGDAQAIREWHNDAELPAGTRSLFTTPQPSADAVRELVAEWKVRPGVTDAYKICADELESLLSVASGEKGVG